MEVQTEVHTATENKAEATVEFDEKACTELFALGKRNFLCGDVPQAVNQLQEVCRLLAAKFGETAPECAEAYFHYGSALLELGRMESRVLGNALQGMTEEEDNAEENGTAKEDADDGFAVPSTITDEEKEKISEEVLDAMLEQEPTAVTAEPTPTATEKAEVPTGTVAEKGDSAAATTASEPTTSEKPSESGDAPSAPAATEKKEETVEAEKVEGSEEKTAEETEAAGEGDGENTEENEDEEEDDTDHDAADVDKDASQDEDVSNLQLAWEMLELAKNIYVKQETKEAKLKQAECLKKLGEVGLESENNSQSIEDFTSCLQIFTDNVDDVKSDRRLAEAHYHIAVACVNAGRYDDGAAHFRDAMAILEAKSALLRETVATATADEAALAAAQNELKEITELVPEIKVKIEDCQEEKNAVHLKDVINGESVGVTTNGFGDDAGTSAMVCETKPVHDVTHLVRKKRKPEDDDTAVEEVKKAKTDSVEIPAITTTTEAVVTANGKPVVHANGAGEKPANGSEAMEVSEPTEIKVKSVADVVASDGEPAAVVAE